jgi:hypothetical protein
VRTEEALFANLQARLPDLQRTRWVNDSAKKTLKASMYLFFIILLFFVANQVQISCLISRSSELNGFESLLVVRNMYRKNRFFLLITSFFKGCPGWGANPRSFDFFYFLIPSLNRFHHSGSPFITSSLHPTTLPVPWRDSISRYPKAETIRLDPPPGHSQIS